MCYVDWFDSCAARSKMGFVESGSFYLHKMRRHPQEPGSAHIQSEVGQPGPVDPGTNPGTPPFIWTPKRLVSPTLAGCRFDAFVNSFG